MKKTLVNGSTLTLFAALALLVGCDYSSGSGDNNFNTRGLASLSNISGLYRGVLDNGRVVANTSAGNITSFTIQQSGNRVEVIDNQGSTYVGSVGNPALVLGPNQEAISEGASVSSYQISFSGKDNVANRDVEFTGVITLVAVRNVDAQFLLVDNAQSANETEDTSSEDIIGSEQLQFNRNDRIDRRFLLSDANTQLRLRGTWKEIQGVTSTVDARAAGIAGNVTFPETDVQSFLETEELVLDREEGNLSGVVLLNNNQNNDSGESGDQGLDEDGNPID